MRTAIAIAVAVFACGCSSGTSTEVPPPVQTPAQSSRAPVGAPPQAPAPQAAGQTPATGAKSPTDEELARLQSAYDGKPTDSNAKQALIAGLVEAGNYYMASPDLPPREKYPKALGFYRRVLAIDPGNAAAKSGVETIESIYKQMGRPVPQV